MFRAVIATAALVAASSFAGAAALPEGATLLDPDMVWDMRDAHSMALSPDGKSIAYVSKGAIWVCSVTAGPPKKLADVPGTATAQMDTSEYRAARGDFNKIGSGVNVGTFHYENSIDWIEFPVIEWTRSQDGVTYATRDQQSGRPWTETHEVFHASLEGDTHKIATVTCNGYDELRYFNAFYVTSAKDYVVASAGYKPLIWDAEQNKPRATPFDYLVPSSTSDHFLGVEIDTRQPVLTDGKLQIRKRYDLVIPQDRYFDLIWSPDERFVVCRLHIQGVPDTWEGFRYGLATGEKRELQGDYLRERIAFSGNGGELMRTGTTEIHLGEYADGGNGTYIAIVPDGDGEQHDVFRFVRRAQPSDDWKGRKSYPPVRWSQDGSLFAAALPRDGDQRGFRYFLIDRSGQRWSLGPDDGQHYVSPYHVVAIANRGQTLIGCDDKNLFSVPVATIQKSNKEAAP
jgi:hypothetical protein